MPDFKPSSASFNRQETALKHLSYARKAIELLEEEIGREGLEVAPWVGARIEQGAMAFGQALSFVLQRIRRNSDPKEVFVPSSRKDL